MRQEVIVGLYPTLKVHTGSHVLSCNIYETDNEILLMLALVTISTNKSRFKSDAKQLSVNYLDKVYIKNIANLLTFRASFIMNIH